MSDLVDGMGEAMARKRYRNALRTERLMAEAYVALAERGERISVSSVCREADLNRTTFYLHYDNIGDLESRLVDDLMAGVADLVARHVASGRPDDVVNLIDEASHYVSENRGLFRLLLTSSTAFDFGDRLRTAVYEATGKPSGEALVWFDFVAGGLTSVYRTWVLGQYGDVDIDTVTMLARSLVAGR